MPHGGNRVGLPAIADVASRGLGRPAGAAQAADQAAAEAAGYGSRRAPPVLLSPDIFMPVGATPLYAEGTAAVAGPASWVVPASIVTRVPSGQIAVIKDLGVTIQNMLVTTVVTWGLRVNGGAVDGGAGNVIIAPRAAAYVEATPFNFNLAVRIPPNSVLDVQITVADAGAYVVGAYYVGWAYPAILAERFARLGG